MDNEKKKRTLEFSSLLLASISVATALITFIKFGNNKTDFFILQPGIIISLFTAAFAAFSSLYIARLRERNLGKRRIFIIYHRANREVAIQIAVHLREKGYNPWLDIDEITPGQKWTVATAKALSESSVALVLISRDAQFSSGPESAELKAAMQNLSSKDETISPVIPIRLDNAPVPNELRDVQGIFYEGPGSIDKLEKGLKRVLGAV